MWHGRLAGIASMMGVRLMAMPAALPGLMLGVYQELHFERLARHGGDIVRTVTPNYHSGSTDMGADFPNELTDETIDEVANAPGSMTLLRVCALVSRTWVTRSQKYIFKVKFGGSRFRN